MSAGPASNRALLRGLVEEGVLSVHWAPLFDEPAPFPPATVDFGRIRGMLLGLAIGDALGNTSEGMLPERRRATFGEVRDYLPNRHAGGRPVGLPSDDTQLAFWTVEHLIANRALDPDALARTFASQRIFGIGRTVAESVRRLRGGSSWPTAAVASAGNGALMRIAPVVLPHLREATADLWVDAALCAALTHNDPASISACVAFVGMLSELLVAEGPPEPQWWVETYIARARFLEGETRYRPRGGPLARTYEGPLWRFVADYVPAAQKAGKDVITTCEQWYSGAYLLETVPSVLYILSRHTDDPEEAIIRAVNDTKDNDTIAAVVGAAAGALHGETGLPQRWRDGLLGRTAEDGDGRVFELLDLAEAAFGARDMLR